MPSKSDKKRKKYLRDNLDEDEKKALMESVRKMRGGDKGQTGQGRPNTGEFLKRYDKNGDGKIDDAEKKAAREAMTKKRGSKQGQRPGQDGPKSRIDRSELVKKFDENGDGKLDENERAKAKEALSGQRKRNDQ